MYFMSVSTWETVRSREYQQRKTAKHCLETKTTIQTDMRIKQTNRQSVTTRPTNLSKRKDSTNDVTRSETDVTRSEIDVIRSEIDVTRSKKWRHTEWNWRHTEWKWRQLSFWVYKILFFRDSKENGMWNRGFLLWEKHDSLADFWREKSWPFVILASRVAPRLLACVARRCLLMMLLVSAVQGCKNSLESCRE